MSAVKSTPPDHAWGCNACPWRGKSMTDAKMHLMNPGDGATYAHYPYEAPLLTLEDSAKVGMTAKKATRVMHPHETEDGLVRVVTWGTAKARLNKVLDPLVESSIGRDPRRRSRG